MTTTLRNLTSQLSARRVRAGVSARGSVDAQRSSRRAAARARRSSPAVTGGVAGLTPLADSLPLRTR